MKGAEKSKKADIKGRLNMEKKTYQQILEEQKKLQRTQKPFISYTRNQLWKGEPCIICGSTKGTQEVDGRYVAGDSETGDLMYLCGKCLEKYLLKDFEAMME